MKRWQRRAVGLLMLGGGITGAAAAFSLLLTRSNIVDWIFCTGFIALYAWGIWCGLRLVESQPGAERSALMYWLIQVPAFSSPVLSYAFSGGFHLTAGLQLSPIALNGGFFFGSTFKYAWLSADRPWFVGVNLFAVAIVWWLARKIPARTAA